MNTTAPKLPEGLEPVAWKCGNEFAPYHPSASHVNPDHRDGWNACYRTAQAALQALAAEIAVLKEDAARYRWLRDGKNPGNRYPHLTQYPYQPDLDKVRIPQMVVDGRLRPENIDAAIDSALLAAKEAK